VFDAGKVKPGEIKASGYQGEVKTINKKLVENHGLKLEKTPGDPKLPRNLRENHWEIRAPEGMSREAFKKALKALSQEVAGGN
jgi:hypothetical protein